MKRNGDGMKHVMQSGQERQNSKRFTAFIKQAIMCMPK